MKRILKIGIVDDDSSKITQIMIRLKQGVSEATSEKQEKYSKYELQPVEIEIKEDLEDMVKQVIHLKIDCVLVDYKLSSYKNVNYTGIEFAKSLGQVLYKFPIFILTSYEDDLFLNEVFNAYQVFDFARYLREPSERIELNYKIIEQILQINKQKHQWESEMNGLLPLAGKSEEIDSRILELDAKLEKSINGDYALPDKLKKDLSSNKLNEILDKIDKVLEKE